MANQDLDCANNFRVLSLFLKKLSLFQELKELHLPTILSRFIPGNSKYTWCANENIQLLKPVLKGLQDIDEKQMVYRPFYKAGDYFGESSWSAMKKLS